MAFNLNKFDAVGVSSNTNAPGVYKYDAGSDNLAAVLASGYFDNIKTRLKIKDLIYVAANDDSQLIRVTAVSPNVTTTQFSEVVDDGSITTAKLADGAVTSGAKMTLPEGNLYLGDASNNASNLDASANAQLLVGDGTTLNSVAMSSDATIDNTGAVTISNSAITTAKINNGAVTQGKITANSLDGTVVRNLAPLDSTPTMTVMYRIDTPGGATADTDITIDIQSQVIGVKVVNLGAGTTSDTVTVKNGANAITDAIDISGGDGSVALESTLDDANWLISAGGTLRVTETDGGGNDSPAVAVFITCLRAV